MVDTNESELEELLSAAGEAADSWSDTPAAARARALKEIATALEAGSEALVAAARAETALDLERLRGEVGRTTTQLRMFADYVERGLHVDAILSEAVPVEARPDVRRMAFPIGPVAVFSAGNFPFAFSVAGSDTASALAAGCPVIVKAHEGHPHTSELSAETVRGALQRVGAPAGLFAVVYGQEAGRRLVQAPAIRAVGFTGSLRGGRALMELAHQRRDPIPFYGELGSINPVVVLPVAAETRAEELAGGYIGSLTLGVGQFCTSPGLLFVPDVPALREAIAHAADESRGGSMLNERIHAGYLRGTTDPGWQRLEQLGHGSGDDGRWSAEPDVRHASLEEFARDQSSLTEERFGPAGLVVTYRTLTELMALLPTLPGTLTASVHAADTELELAKAVGRKLRRHAGRLIFNGWPTGVALCWAMNHGGPWPASTAPWSTSVGATAIRRWQVPVSFQNWPDATVPLELQVRNPLEVPRTVQPSA